MFVCLYARLQYIAFQSKNMKCILKCHLSMFENSSIKIDDVHECHSADAARNFPNENSAAATDRLQRIKCTQFIFDDVNRLLVCGIAISLSICNMLLDLNERACALNMFEWHEFHRFTDQNPLKCPIFCNVFDSSVDIDNCMHASELNGVHIYHSSFFSALHAQ